MVKRANLQRIVLSTPYILITLRRAFPSKRAIMRLQKSFEHPSTAFLSIIFSPRASRKNAKDLKGFPLFYCNSYSNSNLKIGVTFFLTKFRIKLANFLSYFNVMCINKQNNGLEFWRNCYLKKWRLWRSFSITLLT